MLEFLLSARVTVFVSTFNTDTFLSYNLLVNAVNNGAHFAAAICDNEHPPIRQTAWTAVKKMVFMGDPYGWQPPLQVKNPTTAIFDYGRLDGSGNTFIPTAMTVANGLATIDGVTADTALTGSWRCLPGFQGLYCPMVLERPSMSRSQRRRNSRGSCGGINAHFLVFFCLLMGAF
jgi:hypothetical protein